VGGIFGDKFTTVLFLGLLVAVWNGWGAGVFCAVFWLVFFVGEISGTGKSGFLFLDWA
jgi:hypothetical protein